MTTEAAFPISKETQALVAPIINCVDDKKWAEAHKHLEDLVSNHPTLKTNQLLKQLISARPIIEGYSADSILFTVLYALAEYKAASVVAFQMHSENQDATALLDAIMLLLFSGETEKAEELLESNASFLFDEICSLDAYYVLGELYRTQGNYEKLDWVIRYSGQCLDDMIGASDCQIVLKLAMHVSSKNWELAEQVFEELAVSKANDAIVEKWREIIRERATEKGKILGKVLGVGVMGRPYFAGQQPKATIWPVVPQIEDEVSE